MTMRLTSQSMNSILINNINRNKYDLFNTQNQILSGKKINNIDDSPLDTGTLIGTNKDLYQIDNYLSNINMATSEMNVSDGAFGNIIDRMDRALELTMSAANETNSTNSLSAIKAEIDQLKESIIDSANSKYNGQYIFSGTNTQTTPYKLQADGSIVCNATASGGEWKREMEISEGVNVQLNTDSKALFGEWDSATKKGSGIFGTLGKLSEDLNADPPDYQAIRNALDGINDGLEEANIQRTTVGTNAQKANLTKTSLSDNQLLLKTNKSSIQDTDVATAAT